MCVLAGSGKSVEVCSRCVVVSDGLVFAVTLNDKLHWLPGRFKYTLVHC